jgi:type I restriction enzyme, S subunit
VTPASADADLPEGWSEAALGDIARVVGGGTPSTKEPSFFADNGHAWITPADLGELCAMYVSHGRRFLTRRGLDACSAELLPKGTVVMSSRAPIGYVAIAANEVCTNQGCKSFVCDSGVVPEHVYLWLKGLGKELEGYGSGSTFNEVSAARARGIPILIPPTAEQRRIVAKVEELLAEVNQVRARLDRVPAVLKRFRQSVLSAACSGKLTEDWRAQQKDAALLDSERGDVVLSELCSRFEYGSAQKSRPEGKVAVLRMGNLQGGEIDWTDLVYTNDQDEIKQYSLKPNTVLFNRTNSPELVGKTAIYRGGRPAIFAGYLIRIHNGDRLDPCYLNYCLNAQRFREYCAQVRTEGVNQSNINATKLADYEMPSCHLREQREIVRRVEKLFKLADDIGKQVEAATRRVDKITQAILAKAFRGELVPTEAELARREGRSYEPASILLERIRNERQNETPPSRGRGRRVKEARHEAT